LALTLHLLFSDSSEGTLSWTGFRETQVRGSLPLIHHYLFYLYHISVVSNTK